MEVNVNNNYIILSPNITFLSIERVVSIINFLTVIIRWVYVVRVLFVLIRCCILCNKKMDFCADNWLVVCPVLRINLPHATLSFVTWPLIIAAGQLCLLFKCTSEIEDSLRFLVSNWYFVNFDVFHILYDSQKQFQFFFSLLRSRKLPFWNCLSFTIPTIRTSTRVNFKIGLQKCIY